MLDIQATFDWLHYNNVPVLGVNNDVCTGYVFNSGEIPLDGEIGTTIPIAPLLILQGISEKSRIHASFVSTRSAISSFSNIRDGT